MSGQNPWSLPEALLLLCADPKSGRLQRPRNLGWALSGAVLTELRLAGAVTVVERSITAVPMPLSTGDAFADRFLADLREALGKGRPLKLEKWVRRGSHQIDRHYLDALCSKGLLVAGRPRFLGLFPHTVYTAADTGWSANAAARIVSELSARSEPRTLLLAALASTVRLDRRLIRGPGARAARRSIADLARADSVVSAVARTIARDARARQAATNAAINN